MPMSGLPPMSSSTACRAPAPRGRRALAILTTAVLLDAVELPVHCGGGCEAAGGGGWSGTISLARPRRLRAQSADRCWHRRPRWCASGTSHRLSWRHQPSPQLPMRKPAVSRSTSARSAPRARRWRRHHSARARQRQRPSQLQASHLSALEQVASPLPRASAWYQAPLCTRSRREMLHATGNKCQRAAARARPPALLSTARVAPQLPAWPCPSHFHDGHGY